MPRRYDDEDYADARSVHRDLRAEAAMRVRLPAIFILILSGLSILALGGLLIFLTIMLFVEPPRNRRDDILGVTFAFGGTIALLLVKILVALGAIPMLRMRLYPVALGAAIVQIIPCSLCWMIDTPIGIWALIILLMPEVRDAFYAEPR